MKQLPSHTLLINPFARMKPSQHDKPNFAQRVTYTEEGKEYKEHSHENIDQKKFGQIVNLEKQGCKVPPPIRQFSRGYKVILRNDHIKETSKKVERLEV